MVQHAGQGLDLGTWSDEALRVLLERRPDLMSPWPASFAGLEQRATGPNSVLRALAGLDRFSEAVVHGLCLLPPGGATIGELASLLGIGSGAGAEDVLTGALDGLRSLGLAQVSDGRARLVSHAAEHVHRPAGLGPSARPFLAHENRGFVDRVAINFGLVDRKGATAGLKQASIDRAIEAISDVRRVEKGLRHAPDGTRNLFDQMARDGAVLREAQAHWWIRQPKHPVGWLFDRALLIPAANGFEAPREVMLALRGGVAFPGLSARPPALETVLADGVGDARAGASAATDAGGVLERVVAEWAVRPAAELKDGGIGVRELRRAAKAAGVDEPTAALAAELAFAAGLIAPTRGEVQATEAWDGWVAAAPAERWQTLARGWLECRRWPGMAGRKDHRDKVIPALDPMNRSQGAHDQRRLLLEALGAAPAGHRPTAESVLRRAEWALPRCFVAGPAAAADLVAMVLTEAAFLGMTAGGGLTPAGRALAAGDDAALETASAEAFEAPASTVTLQADLTAMVVGVAAPALRAVLDDAADVESRGAATVWRFSEATVRRSLDRGRTADELLDVLGRCATRDVPQPLRYLIGDVARRHGEARVGRATSYVRSDDEGLLARVVAGRRATALGLRLLAPTVAVAAAEPAALLDFLRAEGLAPVEEAADGSLVAIAGVGPRAAAGPATVAAGSPVTSFDPAEVVARLRSAPAVAAGKATTTFRAPPRPRPVLEEAVDPEDIRALLLAAEVDGIEIDLAWEEGAGRRRQYREETVRVVALRDDVVVAVGIGARRDGYRIPLDDIQWAAADSERLEGWREIFG